MINYNYNKEWCDDNRDFVNQNQRIVCAANKHKISGRIICGPRHWDSIMRSQLKDDENPTDFDQGFSNQYCEFLTREEAWVIALDKNQMIRLCYDNQDYLYSESLY